MQFPESWLREFCDPPLSSAQLGETLTMREAVGCGLIFAAVVLPLMIRRMREREVDGVYPRPAIAGDESGS